MRRRRDHAADAAAHYEAGQAAAGLARHLEAGGALASVPAPGLALDPGETAYADVTCGMARFYPTDVVYQQGAGYFESHPTFGRQWVPNRRLDARRRQQAEAEAQAQWRDHTSARVVFTSDGLRINPAGAPADWLPFDHVLLSGISVAAARHELMLSYSVCAPLLLAGQAALWLSIAVRHLSPSTHAQEG
ncbi:hypothetical protein ACFU99_05280 [Streptomyces sp. NPDC057654]|uniref:hypothetical protein n=1 Tax=Streptomyces sp. NPDC057654 TaxID=3346196 RepID=UPI0036CC80E2